MKKLITGLLLAVSLSFGFESDFLPGYTIDAKCSQILHKKAFDICYSYADKSPKFVVYEIEGDNLRGTHYKRKGMRFKPDYQIPIKYRNYTKDFSHTGFDRGHNAPNGSFNYNKTLQKETFLLSNISAQKPQLNRRLWSKIERFSRMQALKYGSVSVVTGVCGSLGHIKNNVNIPAYWYKLILLPNGKMVSFLAPNTNRGMSKAKAKDYLSDIETIEKTCNIKLLKQKDILSD